MSIVLTVEQREQAGSDSYNRFEYQVHWIVCHIIGKLQDDAECIVFCEFHDDMAEFSPDNQQYQFYQIKTKEDPSDWTIAEMSKREKKKSGGYKKSFLGFIFYNYLTFSTECSHCHFVSNNDFDKDVLSWQAVIEDGKKLQVEDIALYQKIKDRIKDEFINDMPSNFDSVFDTFIQNTFVHKSDLQLAAYENQTKGEFFNHLADKNIPTNTANLIFQQLINDVRKKSKEKIKVPISMKRLVEKKGVDVAQIGRKIDGNIKNSGNYDEFHQYLLNQSLTKKDIHRIEAAKTLHDARWLDVNDVKYQKIVVVLRQVISTYFATSDTVGFDVELKKLCSQELKKNNLLSESLDKSLVEVLYCRTLADAINLPKTFIQLRDFVQIINRTGSETPRLVYMYQSALYLYNLRRAYSPFNFYVVDTPNQQGQDANNLESIFKSLELFLSDEGQVIVGTERETGLEEKAGNVNQLSEKRRCLNDFNYSTHLELLEKLQKVAIEWVAINHKAKTNE